ncbi:hypothetical protein M3Y97_00541300 [Aphelenchoides bicaudatus]|nr:hypothetical protein M3Y97_00541300 [Aphelenchoides bicaudatus]
MDFYFRVEKLESCKTAVDQFECVNELNVKPANLLLNFGYGVGFISRFGMRLDVSQMAYELYQNSLIVNTCIHLSAWLEGNAPLICQKHSTLLIYAHQQLSLETNEKLSCTEHHDQDLRHEVYNKGFVFKRGLITSRHFCRNVANPPRRVVHESTADDFKITIGLEYYW